MATERFRVLHTADWHLGKPLHDQDRQEEHKRFLAFLLQTLKCKEIDTLIIAGDIFDSTNPPPAALRLYFDFLAEVYKSTSCSVVVTSGNHDSPAHLEAPKDVLKALNIHVVGAIPHNLKDALILLPSAEKPQLAVAALPFLRDKDLRTGQLGQSSDEIRKNIQKGIRERYQEISEAARAYQDQEVAFIATGHLTVLGARKCESERDTIHIGGLGEVTTDVFPELFSYVALGHLHKPQQVGNEEHRRYSGSPIPLSFSECRDKKEVRVLEFTAGKLTLNDALEVPVTRKLFQLSAAYNDLESTLNSFQPEAAELTHWVELILSGEETVGNVHEEIQRLTTGKPYKVIKTVIESSSTTDGLRSDGTLNNHSLGDLLNNPEDVFSQLLDTIANLDTEEKEELITVFAELYDMVLETKRQCLTPQESIRD